MCNTYLLVRVLFAKNYRQTTDQRPQTRSLIETGNSLLLQRHSRRRQHLRLVVETRQTVDH